ncbi:transcriptional regulator [Rahnella inusitata]|uniref:transcriptional regulator n=1 Tax=Rahnella inusitata TaxID=58169 RepID=UPI001BC831F2|nr:transcriptional regulator [Rahnella inusitata]QUT15070.1 transcriptional regulator [Rahnella inusitata]
MPEENVKVKSKDWRVCRFYAQCLDNKYPGEFPAYDPGNADNCLRNVNTFLDNKYQFDFLHNQEVNNLEIMAGYAILPEAAFSWLKNNELAAFFVWAKMYIDTEDHSHFLSTDRDNGRVRKTTFRTESPRLNTYQSLRLGDSPSTHQERMRIIIEYFDGAHALVQKGSKMAHLELFKQQWLENHHRPPRFKWLNPDDEELCRWFWSRLKEKQQASQGKTVPVSQFFIPSSGRDYYLAALTSFDLWQAPEDSRELFKARINHAWHQQKQKEKYREDDKKAINTYIRKDVKDMLDKLTMEYNLRMSDILEMLITEKYKSL